MKRSDVDRGRLVTEPLPCLVCGKTLDSVYPNGDDPTAPYAGTEFRTYGHYGSTFWDDFDGEELVLVICDDCLRNRKHHLGQQKRYLPIRCKGVAGFGRKWVERPLRRFTGLPDPETFEVEPEALGLDVLDVQWTSDIAELKEHFS